ncbi:MAG: hypothetical protein KAT18_04050, partial [Candidatus Latescibacteria bacterium]|nr:hypothetical protein [Candidatus Latescibacterota bacterium]
ADTVEQADTVEESGYGGMEGLEAIVGEKEGEVAAGTDEEPVIESQNQVEPEEAEETTKLELEGDLSVEGVVEGLEIGSVAEKADETMAVDPDEKEISSVVGDEEMVMGPVELPDDAIEDVSEGLELDDGYDMTTAVEDAKEPAAGEEEPAETAATEIEPGSDVEEALRALEEDLEMKPDVDSQLDELSAGTGEAEEVAEDEATLEETSLEEIAVEEVDLPEGAVEEAVEEEKEEEGEELPGEAEGIEEGSPTAQIKDADDSIRIAIQAEIIAAKGHTKEAIRLFEALHLWEPDRASYKERLDELRRLQQ